MNAEKNLTAETDQEQTKNGNETITIQTALGDEDDVHKCGRCQSEFSTLEAFIQHKLHRNCKRVDETRSEEAAEKQDEKANGNSSSEVMKLGRSSEKEVKTTEDKGISLLGRGRRRKTASLKVCEQSDAIEGHLSDTGDKYKLTYRVSQDGRYICYLCKKTFKTANILRTHMKTHSDEKNFSCELCGTSFRTKGSLIRHNRRHTDERPYRCTLCGQSFRESGALTRHLKALTPCTEKIRFVQYKEILVSKDGVQKGLEVAPAPGTPQQDVVVLDEEPEEEEMAEGETAVVLMEQSQAEALAAAAAAGDNLICQAIINSGIALETQETVIEEVPIVGEIRKVAPEISEADPSVIEIQVKEEFVETEKEATNDRRSPKLYTCHVCNRSFKALSYLRFHVKGHFGYKPFKCTLCEKEFLTGYLLKKHMEVHVSERRYKCGECGKLYKTIGHVREHMRAHSDERPFHCMKCNKGYKTKNALRVHQRTHGNEKPYVCEVCFRGFREKGSLVRHLRHHTGEKPFKCPKCGRGFAEHGTLSRHVRAKGGCHKDDSSEQQSGPTEHEEVDNLATTAIISEDPHAVLVEFSSVVADTQEYIIKTQTGDELEEDVTLIQDSQNEMGNQIMKVVQQIVSQSHGTGSHQIIVRNVEADEEGASISDSGDTITIATPESLTEQVAMTLASAIRDGTLLATSDNMEGTLTMVTTEEVVEEGMVPQQEEFVITSPEEVEIQTIMV